MIFYALLGVVIAMLLVVIALLVTERNSKKDDYIPKMLEMTSRQTDSRLNEISTQMQNLTAQSYEQQIKMMETLSSSVSSMQESNEKKLDEMRATVDEKLTETLNRRINTSFEQVSRQLGAVYKSLGEMKELSTGVTENVKGLNRVLTNVKSRGTWAEVQLGNILEQTIPGMYSTNVRTNPKYNGQVEFAVKIPSAEDNSITWLPIDSKFPMEDYARLQSASEQGDIEALEKAKKALEQRVLQEGRAIKSYISSPETTPFAIMYLATEGLYCEIMSSKNAVVERLQADGIMVAGPSTVTALLNSLSLGFRSIAVNQKANEVWRVLGNAKAQYDKLGDLLAKARRKVDEAGKVLDEADHRNNIIQKNLKNVESLDTEDGSYIANF